MLALPGAVVVALGFVQGDAVPLTRLVLELADEPNVPGASSRKYDARIEWHAA